MKSLNKIIKELKDRDVKVTVQRGLKLNGKTAYKVYGAPTNDHALWVGSEIVAAYYNGEI